MTRRFVVLLGLCCALCGCDAPGARGPVPVLPTRSPPPLTGTPVRVLDPVAVGAGVRKVLVDDFRIVDVGAVACPAGQPVVAGRVFSCTARIGGEAKRVPITVLGGDGRYRVDPPG